MVNSSGNGRAGGCWSGQSDRCLQLQQGADWSHSQQARPEIQACQQPGTPNTLFLVALLASCCFVMKMDRFFFVCPRTIVFVPTGGVPPVPGSGEAGQLLPLSGHLCDGVQPPGLPRQTLVSCVQIPRGNSITAQLQHRDRIADSVLHLMHPFGWFQLVAVVPLCPFILKCVKCVPALLYNSGWCIHDTGLNLTTPRCWKIQKWKPSLRSTRRLRLRYNTDPNKLYVVFIRTWKECRFLLFSPRRMCKYHVHSAVVLVVSTFDHVHMLTLFP